MIENFCFINKNKKIQKVKAESLEKINIPHIYCKTNPCILSLETKKENIPDVNCGNIDQSFYKECNGGKEGAFVVYNGNLIGIITGKWLYVTCQLIQWSNDEKIKSLIKSINEKQHPDIDTFEIYKYKKVKDYKTKVFKDTTPVFEQNKKPKTFTSKQDLTHKDKYKKILNTDKNTENYYSHSFENKNNIVKNTQKYADKKIFKNLDDLKFKQQNDNLRNYYSYYTFSINNFNKTNNSLQI